MATLRVGGPVPNRKRIDNPWTITGRPQWGTFQGLGMRSTCTDLRIQASKAGVKGGGGGSKNHKLDPRNLCHRIKSHEQHLHEIRRIYEDARKISLCMDRLHVIAPATQTRFDKLIHLLVHHGATAHLHRLIRMDRGRGQIRTTITARRFGFPV